MFVEVIPFRSVQGPQNKIIACHMWPAGLQMSHSGLKDYYRIKVLKEMRNKHSEMYCLMNQYFAKCEERKL